MAGERGSGSIEGASACARKGSSARGEESETTMRGENGNQEAKRSRAGLQGTLFVALARKPRPYSIRGRFITRKAPRRSRALGPGRFELRSAAAMDALAL